MELTKQIEMVNLAQSKLGFDRASINHDTTSRRTCPVAVWLEVKCGAANQEKDERQLSSVGHYALDWQIWLALKSLAESRSVAIPLIGIDRDRWTLNILAKPVDGAGVSLSPCCYFVRY